MVLRKTIYLSPPNNKIIDTLHKKFQKNIKPYCLVGFRGVGGGNRARSTAIATEGQSRAVWPKSQGARCARCGTHLRAEITTQTKEKPYCLVGFRGVGGGNRARTCDLTDVNRVL